MGTSHYYKCEMCNKTVSASLEDVTGMNSKVMAVKCNDCGEVSDSAIEQHTDWNNETVTISPSCYKCSSENIVMWDQSCPNCGDVMSDNGVATHWD